MNRPLPTGYCNLETARRVHGGRADQYANFLWRTDPLAEAVIDACSPLPEKEWQAMLTQALDQGIDAVPDAPPALRDFFAQVERVPFWVDRQQCNLGGATFLRCRLGFLALSMHALPLIYSWPSGNKPLALSGHLVHRASQRLKDTTRYVFAICQPDGLGRFSDGFKMTVRVRLIHAQVRKLLGQSGQWRAEAWGAPINQCHLAGTNLLFCVGVLDGLTRIGYRFTSAEREALIHLWRYAGALLGVENELLIAGEWEGHRLLDLMFTFEPKPDDDSRALVRALMGTAHEYLRGFRAGRPCSMNICFGIARALIGPERADALGFPRTFWRWLVPAIRPATWLIETARCFSPAVQSLARVAGPKAFRHLLSERGLRGRTGDFLVPRQIPVRGMKGEDSSKPAFALPITGSPDAGESCPANWVEGNRAERSPASEPIMNETKNKSTPVRVVCLGGGWVAIYLARALRSAIRQRRIDLTVVSRDNYSTVHGLIAEMLTCKVQPQQINASVREWIAPAHFHNAEIESIDLEGKLVLTRRSLDGRAYTLSYDHLVVGLGSVEDLSRYAGIAEHTFPLKTFANCYRLRNHLLSVLEMAAIERNDEERRRLLTFVVAGGNYAGVEVACDLVDYFRLLSRTKYPELKRADFRVVLLEIGARILPELGTRHPNLVRYAEKRIARLGIEVRLNQGLNAATPDAAVLISGETLPSRTIVTCTGMKPSPLLDQFPFTRDKRGRLITDEFCRVPNTGQIWAGGDCAAVPHPDGESCPPLAHYAQKAGSNIGENILGTLSGQLLRPYSFNGLGEACTLGHGSAIAHMKGWPAYGWPAWIGWRFIVLFMFVPSWTRRVRLMLDWFLTMVLGRDVVNPRIDERGAISHALYEPGQIIVPAGDSRRYHYLVEDGEVELVSAHPDGNGNGDEPAVLATLKTGDYFGHVTRPSLDCAVRARTRVRLLAIDREAADALSGVRPDLALLLKRGVTVPATEPVPPKSVLPKSP